MMVFMLVAFLLVAFLSVLQRSSRRRRGSRRPRRPLAPGLLALGLGLLAGPVARGEELEGAQPPEPEGDHSSVPLNLTGRGLFNLLDPFPLAVLHLQLPVNTLEVLRQGDGRFEVGFNWANNFGLEEEFIVDAETYRLELGGWYALRDDFYLGASLPILARDGGILDPVVDGFHDLFGLSDGGRSQRDRNDYDIVVTDEDGDVHDLDRGIGLGGLALRAHWNVSAGDEWLPAVALDGLVGLPTSTQGFGSSGLDFGLATSFYKTLGRDFHLYAVVGLLYFTSAETEGLRYERHATQGTVGLEYEVTRKLSLILQAASYSPLLESPSPLNKSRNYLALGMKWEFLEGMRLELSLIENLVPPFENSADIAIGTGFSFDL